LLYYSILRPSILHFPTFRTASKFVNTGAPSRNRRLLLKTPINLLLLLTKTVSTVENYFVPKVNVFREAIFIRRAFVLVNGETIEPRLMFSFKLPKVISSYQNLKKQM